MLLSFQNCFPRKRSLVKKKIYIFDTLLHEISSLFQSYYQFLNWILYIRIIATSDPGVQRKKYSYSFARINYKNDIINNLHREKKRIYALAYTKGTLYSCNHNKKASRGTER